MHNVSGITTEQESNKTMQSFKNAAISSKQQAARMSKKKCINKRGITELVWCLINVQQAWEQCKNTRSSRHSRHAWSAIKQHLYTSSYQTMYKHGETFCARVNRTGIPL